LFFFVEIEFLSMKIKFTRWKYIVVGKNCKLLIQRWLLVKEYQGQD